MDIVGSVARAYNYAQRSGTQLEIWLKIAQKKAKLAINFIVVNAAEIIITIIGTS